MFDTVSLLTPVELTNRHLKDLERYEALNIYTTPAVDGKTTYVIRDPTQPFKLHYYLGSPRLRIELSIPRFLYGDNSVELDLNDIDLFYGSLHNQLTAILNIDLPKIDEWSVQRMDVYQNFQVGSLVGDYINALSQVDLHNMKQKLIGRNETVQWDAGSRHIKCYDKHKECLAKGSASTITEGILRFETTVTTRELKRLFHTTRAGYLLTREVGLTILNKDTHAIQLHQPFRGSGYGNIQAKLLSVYGPLKSETLMGFLLMVNLEGDHYRNVIGSRNYRRRIRELIAAGVNPFDQALTHLPALWPPDGLIIPESVNNVVNSKKGGEV